MKIYATSDLHGKLDDLNPFGCDVCVIAGDFAPLSKFGKWGLIEQKTWINEKFIPFINKFPEVQFVIVPGNHDMLMDPHQTISHPSVNTHITWPLNARVLINSGTTINGKTFYGSPNVPIISFVWAFESDHDRLNKEFDKIPEHVDVLVTHTPPRIPNSGVDRSLQNGGIEAFGSDELTNVIINKKPKNIFCGHIHSGTHGGVKFEDTMVYNVSRVDERYYIAYEPTIVEI